MSDLIIDAEESHRARSATTAASPVASSSEPSGSASCSSASPLQATIQRRPTPHSTSWRCWSTPPAPTRSTAPCSAVHHPMRPPTSVPVRPRRSRRQPTRSMPTRSSSTTNSPRPSNTTSRKILGRSALDRTAVILDIFAQNASSQEGKAQVELAQLRYRLRAFAQADAPSPSRAAVSVPGARVRPSSRSTVVVSFVGAQARSRPAQGPGAS